MACYAIIALTTACWIHIHTLRQLARRGEMRYFCLETFVVYFNSLIYLPSFVACLSTFLPRLFFSAHLWFIELTDGARSLLSFFQNFDMITVHLTSWSLLLLLLSSLLSSSEWLGACLFYCIDLFGTSLKSANKSGSYEGEARREKNLLLSRLGKIVYLKWEWMGSILGNHLCLA